MVGLKQAGCAGSVPGSSQVFQPLCRIRRVSRALDATCSIAARGVVFSVDDRTGLCQKRKLGSSGEIAQ
eukprot:CAMPEP_0198549384 /NCGR_PEP_ID=MMETSP1462-20131121/72667_1 /TAXON_ID=1333877 /ORGANISM="Brandtodinium nutriculum, Strain RCC3387" /LENGTH=68 /DNA_ID=CAMNT_0044279959 /DNA_START=56 /DNA_END=259 /DNA_ORIENTATION=+